MRHFPTGVRGIRLSGDDACISMTIVSSDAPILTVTSKGYGKRTKPADYRVQGRGGRGIFLMKLTEKNGEVVATRPVNDEQHVVGVVDVTMFSEEDFLPDQPAQAAALFEALGFRVSQVRGASPWRAFRFRFPWLLATIASGLACAVLVSVFQQTLANSIALAFFLTLVLALGESVSIQSMTVSIQALQLSPPTWRWYRTSLRRELTTALLLGSACAALVALVLVLWLGPGPAALIVAATIVLSVAAACFYGLTIPALFHALRLDPRIASGPLTLAVADITSIALYFGLASRLL
jgi:magnesium transporter